MSADQYDRRQPVFDTPEAAFERMAARWFNVDPIDVQRWLAMKDQPCGALFANMQAVFIAGYRLGMGEGNSHA
jgi:hypothetical protein